MMIFEIYKDIAGEFRWRLKAANGQIIACSGEGYKSERSCVHGANVVRSADTENSYISRGSDE